LTLLSSSSSSTPLCLSLARSLTTRAKNQRGERVNKRRRRKGMAQLLHLPDLAAARPPARRRGVAVAVAAAGGRVKQQGEAGKKRRVIRVADPVREGRRLPLPLQLPPPLLAAPVTPSESPAATKQREEDEEERQRYYLNMGYAIRTLREELPDVLYKEPSFDIYRLVELL
jgi:hypothetical protein